MFIINLFVPNPTQAKYQRPISFHVSFVLYAASTAAPLPLLIGHLIFTAEQTEYTQEALSIFPEMKKDYFKNLPSEIFTDILSRLPFRAIARSKCVCKPWLDLLQTKEFVTSYLAKSAPVLFLLRPMSDPSLCSIFEFKDELDLESHHLHYSPLTEFDFPQHVKLRGSANGLLLLYKPADVSEIHFVCNPFTREYIEVCFPEELIHPSPKVVNFPEAIGDSLYSHPQSVTYGFGASKVTGEYKLVRIYHGSVIARQLHGGGGRIIPQAEVHVLTIGTEQWRRVEAGAKFDYSPRTSCVFFNGNLHWIVSDSESKQWISCFDLETERFTSFATPPLYIKIIMSGLSVLGDYLCLCDNTRQDVIVIWLMKEYGVEESWTKEYDVNFEDEYFIDLQGSVKVFKDGDVLILEDDFQLFYYSSNSKTQTADQNFIFGEDNVNSVLLTPTPFSLRSLRMESVIVTF